VNEWMEKPNNYLIIQNDLEKLYSLSILAALDNYFVEKAHLKTEYG